MEETKPDKLYYTIGEVAGELGESVSLVRFWSDRFPDAVRPVRSGKGNRMYSQADLRALRLIHYLVKERRMTLEGAALKMKANPQAVDRREEAVRRLESIRDELKTIASGLNSLNREILDRDKTMNGKI